MHLHRPNLFSRCEDERNPDKKANMENGDYNDYEDLEGEEDGEYGASAGGPGRRTVSFSGRDRRAVLRPEPEVKTLPGTSLYCFKPSELREQPLHDGDGDDADGVGRSYVELPPEEGEEGEGDFK